MGNRIDLCFIRFTSDIWGGGIRIVSSLLRCRLRPICWGLGLTARLTGIFHVINTKGKGRKETASQKRLILVLFRGIFYCCGLFFRIGFYRSQWLNASALQPKLIASTIVLRACPFPSSHVQPVAGLRNGGRQAGGWRTRCISAGPCAEHGRAGHYYVSSEYRPFLHNVYIFFDCQYAAALNVIITRL
jgi:hypothetical protein